MGAVRGDPGQNAKAASPHPSKGSWGRCLSFLLQEPGLLPKPTGQMELAQKVGEWDGRRRETPWHACRCVCTGLSGVQTDTLTPTQAHKEMRLAGKVPELALHVGATPAWEIPAAQVSDFHVLTQHTSEPRVTNPNVTGARRSQLYEVAGARQQGVVGTVAN